MQLIVHICHHIIIMIQYIRICINIKIMKRYIRTHAYIYVYRFLSTYKFVNSCYIVFFIILKKKILIKIAF